MWAVPIGKRFLDLGCFIVLSEMFPGAFCVPMMRGERMGFMTSDPPHPHAPAAWLTDKRRAWIGGAGRRAFSAGNGSLSGLHIGF